MGDDKKQFLTCVCKKCNSTFVLALYDHFRNMEIPRSRNEMDYCPRCIANSEKKATISFEEYEVVTRRIQKQLARLYANDLGLPTCQVENLVGLALVEMSDYMFSKED